MDDSIRTLERDWLAKGKTDSSATSAYVQALKRSGDEAKALEVLALSGELHSERLEAAAMLGHEPAMVAFCAVKGLDEAKRAEYGIKVATYDPGQLARDFYNTTGHLASVKMALAASRYISSKHDQSEEVSQALQATEAWVACPSQDTYDKAEAFNKLRQKLPEWAFQTVTSAHCPPTSCWHHASAVTSACEIDAQGARAAIREALVPWILGGNTSDKLPRFADAKGRALATK